MKLSRIILAGLACFSMIFAAESATSSAHVQKTAMAKSAALVYRQSRFC